MSTSTNLPTPDECFLSVLMDEWLKNSHCLKYPLGTYRQRVGRVLKNIPEEQIFYSPGIILIYNIYINMRCSTKLQSSLLNSSLLFGRKAPCVYHNGVNFKSFFVFKVGHAK